ncbi:CDP-glycerol glycerophosphotransferase, TagB/SpsB family [Ruminococcaceae bacterium YRB3002]|nr:CDP-glycerol glycerophosphotransferase, TagB/SpsB family [Ruminococcaceae bacterium YRB3002]
MNYGLLYIDPGTGSMLFTVLISIVGFLVYFFRVMWVKVKYSIYKGKKTKLDQNKIPVLIFGEAKRYWQTFEPICDEFEKRGIDVVYWTTSPDDPALEKKYEHIKAEFIGEGNKAYARLNMVNASVVIATTPGLKVYQWKRSKFADCYIHVLHGAYDITTYRMFGTDYFDAVLLSGQYQADEVRKMEEMRELPAKDIELVGVPFLDVLKEKFEKADVRHGDVPTVLLAPSWGPNSIFNVYGGKVIDELIKTGYNIIIRPHHQSFVADKALMDDLTSRYPDSDKLKWDRTGDNFESLCNADIMITDFSGIIFDFTLVFNKPVLYTDTTFDWSCYDQHWFNTELWTLSILPRLGMKISSDNLGDIKNMIDTCINDSSFSEGRDLAREQTWANIGHGAEKTVDYVMKKYDQLIANQAAKEADEAEKTKKTKRKSVK